MPADEPTMLTSREVAALLHVHPKHVYRLLKRGLPARRLGGEWRFVRDEVLAWSAGRELAPDAPSPRADGAPTHTAAPVIAANGDLAVLSLLEVVNEGATTLWSFAQADRTLALRWLSEGKVLAAGSHGGASPGRAGAHRLARIHLVDREVGLAARAGPPPLAGLRGLRVAARASSAGIQARFVEALRAAKVSPDGFAAQHALASHRDVAFAVLRGEADVGLTTRAWAAACGLRFRAIATEPYGIVVRSEDLGAPAVVRLCEAAQSTRLRAALARWEGYDAARAGDIRFDAAPPGPLTPAFAQE